MTTTMANPYVYGPPLNTMYYPQQFFPPYPLQYYPRTPGPNYYFKPDLRPPYILPFYSGTRHRFPIPLPAVPTPGQHARQTLQPEDRARHRRSSPPRSQSVPLPPEHYERGVQDPLRTNSRAMFRRPALVQRSQSRSENPRNEGERNQAVDQGLQDPPRLPRQRRSSLRANGRAHLDGSKVGRPYINPWIDAHNPRAHFIFDLASPEYASLVDTNGRRVRLEKLTLKEQATNPPIIRMHVVIEEIPQWPCDITARVAQPVGVMSFITLRDVLRSLHKHLHQCISHDDWNLLGEYRQNMVKEAFRRRYTRNSDARMERSKGVKRVDYLLGKTRMVGLLWIGRKDGCEMMKLILRS